MPRAETVYFMTLSIHRSRKKKTHYIWVHCRAHHNIQLVTMFIKPSVYIRYTIIIKQKGAAAYMVNCKRARKRRAKRGATTHQVVAH